MQAPKTGNTVLETRIHKAQQNIHSSANLVSMEKLNVSKQHEDMATS